MSVEGGFLLQRPHQHLGCVRLGVGHGGLLAPQLTRTWSQVAVAVRIRALLAAVAVRLSTAATLASMADSCEGPFSSEWKNFGHLLSRCSLVVV